MKKLFSIIAILCLIGNASAQGTYEAFRFSQTDYQGTARYMGAGGVFSSTGGDFSALISNPAALGLYKRNDVTITPLVVSISQNNTLYNQSSSATKNPKYTLPQCGVVITSKIEDSPWKAWQFGFGYNRIMDYNNTYRIEGNTGSSMASTIAQHANGTYYGQLAGDGYLAWNTWMIDTLPGQPANYGSPFAEATLDSKGLVRTTGGLDEISISFGGNYNDKLYIGGSIGVPILDYTERIEYTESTEDSAVLCRGIRSFTTNSTQSNTSGGVNLKLGVIYQPVSFFRFGIGFQTPTYYWKVKDEYTRSMVSYFTNGEHSDKFTYDNRNYFTLTTPLKANVSATFLIKQRAFLSAEYEFYDYSSARLYSNDYDYTDENDAIRADFGIAHTLRLGGEVSLTDKFALRAGYNFKSTPYKNSSDQYNASVHYGSVGFGIHTRSIYFDLAYVLRYTKDTYCLYENDLIKNSNITHRIVATIGCKF